MYLGRLACVSASLIAAVLLLWAPSCDQQQASSAFRNVLQQTEFLSGVSVIVPLPGGGRFWDPVIPFLEALFNTTTYPMFEVLLVTGLDESAPPECRLCANGAVRVVPLPARTEEDVFWEEASTFGVTLSQYPLLLFWAPTLIPCNDVIGRLVAGLTSNPAFGIAGPAVLSRLATLPRNLVIVHHGLDVVLDTTE
eukprot:RCo015168